MPGTLSQGWERWKTIGARTTVAVARNGDAGSPAKKAQKILYLTEQEAALVWWDHGKGPGCFTFIRKVSGHFPHCSSNVAQGRKDPRPFCGVEFSKVHVRCRCWSAHLMDSLPSCPKHPQALGIFGPQLPACRRCLLSFDNIKYAPINVYIQYVN